MNKIIALREFASGNLSAEELKNTINADGDVSGMDDQEFIQECVDACLGVMLQGEYLDEAAADSDAMVAELISETSEYLAGQGIMSEATGMVSVNNPKVNFVRLNKEAQINRLQKIVVLKLARNAKNKAFGKYKLATASKKKYMEEMMKTYGSKAERIAKEMHRKSMKNGKVAAKVKEKVAKK